MGEAENKSLLIKQLSLPLLRSIYTDAIIHTIDSIKIYMYFFDHAPPHFHAKYNEHEELIDIRTMEVLAGSLPKKQHKKVIKWAVKHQEQLFETWNEHNPTT